MPKTDWSTALKPLIKQYKGKPHPLEYKNIYQLVVMVILSAQDSDRHINQLAPPFFKAFPNMKTLAKANEAMLLEYIGKVRNSANKTKWLMKLAQTIKTDKNIPLTMEELVALPGIGRKSANVIMREAKVKAEGVMVDLHVVRVAPRIGIATSTDPKAIEKQIMEVIPRKDWGEIGMAISHLGREICRPSHPKHHDCVVQDHCEYYKESQKPQRGKAVKTARKLVKRAK
jgi:endonuclease-3